MEMIKKDPRVSVCVVTYNQEKYIRQCLQSIVDQETDFDFEVIVGDDCSTDGTRAIVTEFAERYPHIVKSFFHATNIGPSRNYIFVHDAAKGEFISHVDGDDYALADKLQTQVDFLIRNPICNIVWHRMFLLNEKTGVMAEDLIDFTKIPESGFDRADMLRFITIGLNSSKMYRANVRDFDMPVFPVVDYFANVEQIRSGRACFAGSTPLGVYRTGIGVASSGSATKILLGKTFLYFSEKYPAHCRDISAAALVLFLAALRNKRWSDSSLFLRVLLKTFRIGAIRDVLCYRNIISMLRFPNAVRAAGR